MRKYFRLFIFALELNWINVCYCLYFIIYYIKTNVLFNKGNLNKSVFFQWNWKICKSFKDHSKYYFCYIGFTIGLFWHRTKWEFKNETFFCMYVCVGSFHINQCVSIYVCLVCHVSMCVFVCHVSMFVCECVYINALTYAYTYMWIITLICAFVFICA